MGRFLVCALALLFASHAEAAPRRIVSLDYCADQYVLALADRAQIVALSIGSRRDDSYFRERAVGIRQTRGSLEHVLALRPDLIVRNWGGPWDAAEAFGRFGVPVLQVGDAPNFAAARADMLDAASALGHPERGAQLAADLDLRLARLRERAPAGRPPVMYMSAAGAVAGSGVLMHDVITQAGGRNAWGGTSWTVLPLERMVQTPPALIATGFFGTGRTRVDAWAPSRHPVLRRALAQARTVALPAGAISCEAWYAIDAAEAVQAALLAP